MTTTDSFQIKPDYFCNEKDCIEHKYEKHNTNPRYKNFCQTHFTAGDEEQFRKYSQIEYEPDGIFKYISINNIFRNHDIDIWEKYKCVNDDTMLNTFKYIFYKFKKGIFVKIINNELKVFLPFSNINYQNEWSELIDTQNILSIMRQSYKTQNYVFKDKYINKFPEEWYANNSILRLEYPISEKDTNICIYKDMLIELCKTREIPDVEFFLNRRDNPILTKNLCEPYDCIWGENKPLVSHLYNKYTPILSMSTEEKHADLLFPTYDDWARVQQDNNKWFVDSCCNFNTENFNKVWQSKKQTAIFRGSATGTGICEKTNIRIKASFMSESEINKKESFLDAGIVKWNCRPKKIKNNKSLQILDIHKLKINLKNYMTLQEQSNYKYILHIQGHVEAFRLSIELSMYSVVLLVQNTWKLWYSDLLEPYIHYVPVKEDLSDLFEIVKWCRQNDDKCKNIARNAFDFYEKYLNKNSILDYTQKILYDISKSMCKKESTIDINKKQLKYKLNYVLQKQNNVITKYNYTIDKLKIPCHFKQYYSFHRCLSMLLVLFSEHIVFVSKIFETKYSNVYKYNFVDNFITIKKTNDSGKKDEYLQEMYIGYNCTNILKKDIPNFSYIYCIRPNQNETCVLFSEYVNGITLHQYLMSDDFDIIVLINIFTQLYYALQIAQDKYGFVHYDLTPWNIILKPQDKPVDIHYKLHNKIVVINCKFIAVMIDYGKSVINQNNKKPMSNYHNQDMITLFFTTTKHILKKAIDKNILTVCFNIINSCVKENFTTVHNLKKFVLYNSKYSVLVFQHNNNIKYDCTNEIETILHKYCKVSLINVYKPYIDCGIGTYMFHLCFNRKLKNKLHNKISKLLLNKTIPVCLKNDINNFVTNYKLFTT